MTKSSQGVHTAATVQTMRAAAERTKGEKKQMPFGAQGTSLVTVMTPKQSPGMCLCPVSGMSQTNDVQS